MMPVTSNLNLNVNVTQGDTSLHETGNEESKLILFVCWGILLPLIAAIGLVGNILTMIVLWRKEMHSTTILYLRGLVVTDTGILIGSVITLTPISCANYLQGQALMYFRDSVYPLMYSPAYYIIMSLQQCNVWITVAVSMERYVAICHPFRAARLVTRRKTILVMITIVILSLLYNIPHLFAYQATPCAKLPDSSPVQQATPPSSAARTCLRIGDTDFGTTELYKRYRTVMYSIIIYVVPFLALVVLNTFLIKELMTMQRRRSGTNIHEENEANLSLVLVLIVIVFIFCQTPGLISQFDVISTDVFFCWLAVSNLLFATNSAVNFLIYTAFGRKFRRVLLRIFRRVCNRKRGAFQSSYRTTLYTKHDLESSSLREHYCSSLRSLRCHKNDQKSPDKPESLPLQETMATKDCVPDGKNLQEVTNVKDVIESKGQENLESCDSFKRLSFNGMDFRLQEGVDCRLQGAPQRQNGASCRLQSVTDCRFQDGVDCRLQCAPQQQNGANCRLHCVSDQHNGDTCRLSEV
ncbi:FMRFamide receptor-like [Physella acuta]|uniref:FMRFamide receptor-like n=1 Tax=Physella acuta TaxID=109671 RepID=UPI0027DB797F|nr:FMRFamide receptor-like [Physella acuta]